MATIGFEMPTICIDLNGYEADGDGAIVDSVLYDTVDNLFNKGYLIFARRVTGTIEDGTYTDTLDYIFNKEFFNNAWDFASARRRFVIKRGESGGGEPA